MAGLTLAHYHAGQGCRGPGDYEPECGNEKDYDQAEEMAEELARVYRVELLEARNWAMQATVVLEMLAKEAQEWTRKLKPVVREYRRDVRELTEETGCELYDISASIPDVEALSMDLEQAAAALAGEFRRSATHHLQALAAIHHKMAVEVDA